MKKQEKQKQTVDRKYEQSPENSQNQQNEQHHQQFNPFLNYYTKRKPIPYEIKNKEQALAETNKLYQQKIESLETSLLNLAKQKIKGKKDAEKLVKDLEENWNQAKAELTTNLANTQTELTTAKQELADVKQTNQNLQNSLTNQQTTNQTLQTHYETRKSQALGLGIVGLGLIIFLAWPPKNEKEVQKEATTWI